MRWTRWTFEEANMPETLQAKPVKQEVLEMIQQLPDDCTLEDIQYQLYVRAKVAEGIKALDKGRVVSDEEAQRRMAQWLK
jgi:predicted transcriptional regulator